MSIQEIEKAIQDTEIALSANPQGRTKELLLIGLQAFNDMLLAEQQKKSESQAILAAATNPSLGIPSLNETPEKKAADAKKEFGATMSRDGLLRPERNPVVNQTFRESIMNTETRVIGTVTAAPVITIPIVEIALSSDTKQMNRSDIMNMLKTWFKRVATSKAMEKGRFSDAYGGAMGQDTYKLFQGWNTIYNETKEGTAWPPMEDCFPGLGRASQSQKVNAEILWRWASNDK